MLAELPDSARRWSFATREAIEDALRQAQRSKPGYSQLLQVLLRRELVDKRRRTIANRLKHCGITDYWTLESFPWHIQKSLAHQGTAIERLAELDFLKRAESVVLVGKPGVGKNGVASAIRLKALDASRTARAITAQNLFEEFDHSQADRFKKADQAAIERGASARGRVWLCPGGHHASDHPAFPPHGKSRHPQEQYHHDHSRLRAVGLLSTRRRTDRGAFETPVSACSEWRKSTFAIPPTSYPRGRLSRP
jgi:IstB-like ATP binding protein